MKITLRLDADTKECHSPSGLTERVDTLPHDGMIGPDHMSLLDVGSYADSDNDSNEPI